MLYRKQLIDQLLPTSRYGLYFRLVEIEDAKFINSLRTNKILSKYINKTSKKLEDQVKWLKEYKKREENGKDFYIICLENNMKTKLGLMRIYDIKSDNSEIGSWLFSLKAGKYKSILCDLFIKSIVFEKLNIKICRISIRKKNKNVLKYIKTFSPKLISEDNLSYYFEMNYTNFSKRRNKILEYLDYAG